MVIKHISMKDVCFQVSEIADYLERDGSVKMPVAGYWWNLNKVGHPFQIRRDVIYINKKDLGLWIVKDAVEDFRRL